jgi:two-component system response regulator HydG
LEPEEDNLDRTPCNRDRSIHGDEWLDIQSLEMGSQYIGGMVVQSTEMRRVGKTVEILAPYKVTVLVYGESGTGKELVARALHTLGMVPKGPFVTFNCSNLVDSLAESQLFGHVRGAFTDARQDSLGYFRSADGGTLFLDEIGELPLQQQSKLLRAVETHEIQPVGSAQSYKVDIRLITATNRDLGTMVKAGQFRDDLYYRLNATAIAIPPLRRRRDEIGALTAHFIEHYNQLFGRSIRFISREALAMLMAYDWPGNVRELSHAIQNAVILTKDDRLDIAALPEQVAHTTTKAEIIKRASPMVSQPAEGSTVIGSPEAQSSSLLDRAIRKALIESLKQSHGNLRFAADLLGISRSTIYRMLARYELAQDGTGQERLFRRRRVPSSIDPA